MSAPAVLQSALVAEAEEDLPIPVHMQKARNVLVLGLRESPALRRDSASR